ncbi:SinI family restriction endonuclease [Dolichospermum circinale CS-545/17]|nr:SinI family restriction endonuclease [Dolichospermum circinale CS-545/17]
MNLNLELENELVKFKTNYGQGIKKSWNLLEIEDPIINDNIFYLFLFLEKYEKLLSFKPSEKNSQDYFNDIIKKYISPRKNKRTINLTRGDFKIGETIPDHMIRLILLAQNDNNKENVKHFLDGHRMAMSAENILGVLLEPYIAQTVESVNWIWCSGQMLIATDFLKIPVYQGQKWTCLQVKNANNTENSASSKIREIFGEKGDQSYKENITMIKKPWFRTFSTWTTPLLKEHIYKHLEIDTNQQKPLNNLKGKLKERGINEAGNFSEPETWIKLARALGRNDLVDSPERKTNWEKLNKILDLPPGKELSEDKFKEYIEKLF